MNAAQVVREADRVSEMLRLVQDKEPLLPRSGKGLQALSLLACLEKRLLGLRHRLLEAALTDLLWQYQEYCDNEDTLAVVRQLIVNIGLES
jgi:hypothetical protein